MRFVDFIAQCAGDCVEGPMPVRRCHECGRRTYSDDVERCCGSVMVCESCGHDVDECECWRVS